MAETIKRNILANFISEEIFDKTWDYEYNAGILNPTKYMEVNVSNIDGLVYIKIGRLNYPGSNASYWCTIKKEGQDKYSPPEFFTMDGVADYVARYIGSNLIWIDI